MFYKSAHHFLYQVTVPGMKGLESKNWGEMSVTDSIFGWWELAIADLQYL